MNRTFIDQSTSSWLDLPGLESNTTYTVDIRMQLANTSNHNIWSEPNRQTITTLISQPVTEEPVHEPSLKHQIKLKPQKDHPTTNKLKPALKKANRRSENNIIY